MQPAWPFIGLVATALLLTACIITYILALTPTSTQPPLTPTPGLPTPTPELPTSTPEPPTPTPEPSTATSSSGAQSGSVNLDEIFPPGQVMERNLVIFNCAHCHTWVCAVRGQRPVGHWRSVQATHQGLFPALSDEDYRLLFDFLAENFNDTKPGPDLPAELRSLGCTRPYY